MRHQAPQEEAMSPHPQRQPHLDTGGGGGLQQTRAYLPLQVGEGLPGPLAEVNLDASLTDKPYGENRTDGTSSDKAIPDADVEATSRLLFGREVEGSERDVVLRSLQSVTSKQERNSLWTTASSIGEIFRRSVERENTLRT
jgi:hypothetical protein